MTTIAILKDQQLTYDCGAPFHPAAGFPEYPFEQVGAKNSVYAAIRETLRQLGLDAANYGTAEWNPLGEIIEPGNTVLLKPNCVRHHNPVGDMDCLVTHGSVIRAMLDFVYIALKGKGRVVIGDAPLQDCDFQKVAAYVGLNDIVDFYRQQSDLQLELVDFRLVTAHTNITGVISTKQAPGDQSGYVAVNLKQESELSEISEHCERFRVTNYDKREMLLHHNRENNEYLIPNSVLQADVIVNLPKLKTHRKAGVTCSLKNLVGINGCKDWLAHHRYGSVEENGDEYLHKSWRKRLTTGLLEKMDVLDNRMLSSFLKLVYFAVLVTEKIVPPRDPYREGSWYGNDTLPRTVADLNRIALYADKNGVLRDTVQRRFLVVVDAIVAGEKEGPLEPSAKQCGLLVAGFHPVLVDLVCAEIMGFDYHKIPLFKYALKERSRQLCSISLDEIEFASDRCKSMGDVYAVYGDDFVPTAGWAGHIERADRLGRQS